MCEGMTIGLNPLVSRFSQDRNHSRLTVAAEEYLGQGRVHRSLR